MSPSPPAHAGSLAQIEAAVATGLRLAAQARTAFHAGDRAAALAALARLDGVHHEARRAVASLAQRTGAAAEVTRHVEQLGGTLEGLRRRAQRTTP
jgi:hypothetical protein